MAAIKTRLIASSLPKKGFVPKKDRDHTFYFLYIDDKKSNIFTKISHGEDEINDFLIKKMSSQVKLNKQEFEDLINCPLSHEKYIELVKRRVS